jgi:hypothetical protein
MQAVAPELGRARHQGVLVVQPAAELVLTHGEGVRIGGRLDLFAQCDAEALQRLERLPGRLLEPGPQLRRFGPELAGDLDHQLAAAAEHAERGVHEDRRRLVQRVPRRIEETRDRLQPFERCGRATARRSVPPGDDGIQALEDVRQPVARIADVGTLVLQAEDRAPDLAQQRGAIDLGLYVVRLELLDRALHRTQPGQVRLHGLGVEPAETRVLRHQSGRARGRRVEMVLQIQIGPAEIVDRRHGPSRRVDQPFAITSE